MEGAGTCLVIIGPDACKAEGAARQLFEGCEKRVENGVLVFSRWGEEVAVYPDGRVEVRDLGRRVWQADGIYDIALQMPCGEFMEKRPQLMGALKARLVEASVTSADGHASIVVMPPDEATLSLGPNTLRVKGPLAEELIRAAEHWPALPHRLMRIAAAAVGEARRRYGGRPGGLCRASPGGSPTAPTAARGAQPSTASAAAGEPAAPAGGTPTPPASAVETEGEAPNPPPP